MLLAASQCALRDMSYRSSCSSVMCVVYSSAVAVLLLAGRCCIVLRSTGIVPCPGIFVFVVLAAPTTWLAGTVLQVACYMSAIVRLTGRSGYAVDLS